MDFCIYQRRRYIILLQLRFVRSLYHVTIILTQRLSVSVKFSPIVVIKNFLYPRKSFEYNLIKLKVYENNLLSDQKNLKKELNYFKDDFKHKCFNFFNQLQEANILLGQKLSSNPMFEKNLDIDKWNSNYLNNVYDNQKDNHLIRAYFANKHLIQAINCEKFDFEIVDKVLNSNQKNNFIIILIAYFAILPIVYLFMNYVLRFKKKSSRN